METTLHETLHSLAVALKTNPEKLGTTYERFSAQQHRYLKDVKINLLNALHYATLSKKEAYLLALATSVNEKNSVFTSVFSDLATAENATEQEVLEAHACVSLMNTNNVFYRFRHFTNKAYYADSPAGIKMSIMLNPASGKEFFELMSLAVSALNGCELCVRSHEESLLKLGSTEQRVYDAVRLVSIVKGFLVLT